MNYQPDNHNSRRTARSVTAIGIGFGIIVVLSLAVDQVLHTLGVFPPWGVPMTDPGLNLLALAYRIFISVFGCYITARMAPHGAMRHALMLGAIGVLVSALGAAAATQANLGPLWYPIALVVVAMPCAWIGGYLYQVRSRKTFAATQSS